MKSASTAEAVARTAQVLAHPVRLEILELLRDEGAYVMHLTRALNCRQAYLSQHLAVLRDAGLVVAERRGMTVVYRVSDPRLFDLLDAVREMTPALGKARDATLFSAGVHRVQTVRGCHCPRCSRRG